MLLSTLVAAGSVRLQCAVPALPVCFAKLPLLWHPNTKPAGSMLL